MSVRRPPAEYYADLVAAFRLKPGNYTHAAQAIGITHKTAEKAWNRGWPGQGLAAISNILAEEQRSARALIEQERRAELAKQQLEKDNARKDAADALRQEGQIVRIIRSSTLQSLTAVATLAAQTVKLRETIDNKFILERAKIDAWIQYENDLLAGKSPNKPALGNSSLSLESMVHLLNRVADYMGKCADNARKAMEMERLVLGEPTDIIAIADQTTRRPLSLEEARVRREAANRAIDSAEQAGGLTVLQGGKVEPRVGQRVVPR